MHFLLMLIAIYISGSNSKFLSGELATLIAGRYIQIRVYPFTLSEVKASSEIDYNKLYKILYSLNYYLVDTM